MPTFRIASPEAADARTVLAEYFTMRAAEFPGGNYSPTYPTAAAFAAPDGVFLLVVDDDDTVGCGGIRRVAMPDGELGVFEIKHVFLRPRTRGRGWGRLLLNELELRAREFGARALVLDTHHTLDAAGQLYRTSGFAEIARYNDNPNATRWYRKQLDVDGMSVNERLVLSGLLVAFDTAIAASDADRATRLLLRAGLPAEAAAQTVQAVLQSGDSRSPQPS